MAKKNRKNKPQANLSLKDRLTIHWKRQNWIQFVELYYRDKPRSDQNFWAPYLADGLYNALTQTIVEAPATASIVDLANKLLQEAKGPDADLLSKCAQIALALAIDSKPDNYPKDFEIALLPEPYQSIGLELAKIKPYQARKLSTPAEQLVQKINKSLKSLEQAKSISPFNSLLKYSQELQQYVATETSSATSRKVIEAIPHLATLLHQLKTKSSRSHNFGNIKAIYGNPSFKALGVRPAHPVLIAFWDVFCRLGQNKFGDEWVNGARVLALTFMPGLAPKLSTFLKEVMSITDKKTEEDFIDFVKMFHSALAGDDFIDAARYVDVLQLAIRKGDWIDQELFVIHNLLIQELFSKILASNGDDQTDQDKILSSFSKITEIGQKYRHGFAIWPSEALSTFEACVKHYFTPASMLVLSNILLPWAQFSVPLCLAIFFHNNLLGERIFKTKAKVINQVSLTDQVMSETADIISSRNYPVGSQWLNIAKLLSPENTSRLYEAWLKALIANSNAKQVKLITKSYFDNSHYEWFNDEIEFINSTWDVFDNFSLNFGLTHGPKTGFFRSFLDILKPSVHKNSANPISDDPQKVKSFFDELLNGPPSFALHILIVKDTCFDFPPDFLSRLIDIAVDQAVQTKSLNYLFLGVYGFENERTYRPISMKISDRLSKLKFKNDEYVKSILTEFQKFSKNKGNRSFINSIMSDFADEEDKHFNPFDELERFLGRF
ncbi:MAG: hypothetical protein LBI10_02180 [Deltaproteobacteria bacterium]|jgi:hypothetical protein|nr:hypothetical protein [Deltaproteobacteria bacterium]